MFCKPAINARLYGLSRVNCILYVRNSCVVYCVFFFVFFFLFFVFCSNGNDPKLTLPASDVNRGDVYHGIRFPTLK